MTHETQKLPTDSVELLNLRKPTEEEMQVYHKCISGSYFTAGLPFALISYFLTSKFKKPGNVQQPTPFIKNYVIFFANSILGTILYLPFCYGKFSKVYLNNIKREQEAGAAGNVPATQLTEGTLAPISVEDFSYPTDAVTQFNESDSSFSGDFSYSRLLEDDSDLLSAKAPTTTYNELRARHRNEQTKPSTTPVEKSPSTPSTKEPLISPRPVKKNMYGDEIE